MVPTRDRGRRLTVVRGAVDRLLRAFANVAATVVRRTRIRFIHVPVSRIGEFGASLGCFAAAREAGWLSGVRGVFVGLPEPLCNACYLRYWERHVTVVWNPILYRLLFRVAQRPGTTMPDDVRLPDGTKTHRDRALVFLQALREDERRPPLLELRDDHVRSGRAQLARLGVPEDGWLVALHVREGGYLGEGRNTHRQHRNADIETYLPAIRALTERGGWVVRMGDPTMKPLPELERVIDYAHSPHRSEELDVFLAGSCRFFLGTSSGLFVVAWSFGRPCALTNWDSLVSRPWSRRDLYIPKLWWLEREDRYVRVDEMARPPFDDGRFEEGVRTRSLRDVGVRLIDNAPEEISELALEALELSEGRAPDPETTRRRAAFDALLGRYPVGAGARLGAGFLTRYPEVFLGLGEAAPPQGSRREPAA